PLSLHDALPILAGDGAVEVRPDRVAEQRDVGRAGCVTGDCGRSHVLTPRASTLTFPPVSLGTAARYGHDSLGCDVCASTSSTRSPTFRSAETPRQSSCWTSRPTRRGCSRWPRR